jgi:hypothetical protein
MRLWPISEKRAARVVAATYGTGLRAEFLLVHRLFESYRVSDPDGSLLARAYQDGVDGARDE